MVYISVYMQCENEEKDGGEYYTLRDKLFTVASSDLTLSTVTSRVLLVKKLKIHLPTFPVIPLAYIFCAIAPWSFLSDFCKVCIYYICILIIFQCIQDYFTVVQ